MLFWSRAFMSAAALLLLSGCAASPQESEELIVVEQEKEETEYTLTLAARGDVVLTREIPCTYEQLVEEEISFAVSGRRVSEVYVSLEDAVCKGQVLARLGDEGLSDRIDELEYQIARNQALLEHNNINENYELSALWLQFLYRSARSEQDVEARDESIASIQEKYRYAREDYEDAIELDSLELDTLKKELADSFVYAGIDGTVEWIADDLEGSTSVREEPIMRIVDGSECLFVVRDMDLVPLFREGVPVELTIGVGAAKGNYSLLPCRMEDWEKEKRLLFVFTEETGAAVEMGIAGTITVVLQKRENVVTVPARAVHSAEEKDFVYCLDGDGMREIRWVETGLYGDDSVEILSGLSEGEKVILR